MKYNASGPSVSNLGVKETSPYQYDLKAYEEKNGESLGKTDIDLSTAQAFRVYLYDEDRKKADQAIRFTDGKGIIISVITEMKPLKLRNGSDNKGGGE
ncbi:hypothetical protein GPL15_02825 [Clostridium sp. MCC353]|uniref:hypothetical protein n=1 Tax=Clostridium sp. MCC353 TaxID=2592646 RepID=UPI001C021382|nr:hypothetical protein [Clostridium sp. MCC353]MBT9775441.1 hypothetical protein [Clostridium sp. MCC353]